MNQTGIELQLMHAKIQEIEEGETITRSIWLRRRLSNVCMSCGNQAMLDGSLIEFAKLGKLQDEITVCTSQGKVGSININKSNYL